MPTTIVDRFCRRFASLNQTPHTKAMLARHVRLPFDRRTKTLASLACSGEAGARPLDNEIALELSDGAEHVVIYDNSDWPSVHDLPTAQKAKVLAPGPRQ